MDAPSGALQQLGRPGLPLRLGRSWLQAQDLDPRGLHRHLVTALPWQQPWVRVYGRSHPTPRLVCWVADPGCTYRYSGLAQAITPWTPQLSRLRDRLQLALGVPFNSLLLNRYRTGADRMGWHADDEPELDPLAPIASLSLGATRSLRFRPRPSGRGPAPWQGECPAPLSVELADGDLLVMDPPSQSHWQHALPVRARAVGERINLTFRRIRPR